MKAVVYDRYGPPENLRLEEIPIPKPKKQEVLVRIHATALNASDIEFLTANPSYVRTWGLFRPKYRVLGSDISGVVKEIGQKVSKFQIGDEVFGDIIFCFGGFAEYVCVPENLLVKKPDGLSHEEAATLPQSGLTSLQGLREKGKIKGGEQVLINGGGGGSGSFAIQLAKMWGTEVTGVDKSEKFDFMESLGADHVIDYSENDFTKAGKQYDLILDFVSTHSPFALRKVLKQTGRYVLVGGATNQILKILLLGWIISKFSSKSIGMLAYEANQYLEELADFVMSGKIKPIIDRRYSLDETKSAMQYLYEGKTKGNLVINVIES